jgi:hypothetical protein
MIDQSVIKNAFGEDSRLSFYQYSRQKYSHVSLPSGVLDELMIGVYHKEGGTSGEFSIKKMIIGGKFSLELCMFDDSWKLIPYLTDFFSLIAKCEDISLTYVVLKLVEIGFVDLSDRPIQKINE